MSEPRRALSAASIVAFPPNVTRAEALREFSRSGLSSMYWRVKAGSLQRIADVYVPYQFYEVRYEMGSQEYSRLFAMDAVDGSLDLFEFPQLPSCQHLLTVDTHNRLQPTLLDAAADELLREKAMRLIFQRGFFKLRHASLHFSRLPERVYLPYWLGFYASGDVVRCRVMDAVRRRIEGGKASAFFEQWLAS